MHRYTITLDAEAREKLEMLLKVHTTEQRMAERARIILLAADGKGVSEIAEKLDCSKRRVCGWKKRYLEEGMAGLEEKQRSGRPLRISEFGGQSFRNEKYKCFGFKWTVISVLNGQFCVNSETGVHITPKRVSRLLRNGCPDYSETGVQITPKRVSRFLRNQGMLASHLKRD